MQQLVHHGVKPATCGTGRARGSQQLYAASMRQRKSLRLNVVAAQVSKPPKQQMLVREMVTCL